MNTGHRILLFKGRGVISLLIRLRTRSVYSHAAILTPHGTIIEAWQGAGVRCRTLDSLKSRDNIEAFELEMLTEEDWEAVTEFALNQVGSKYDYRSVLKFITRTKAHPDGKWFCSELVFEAVKVGSRLKLLSRTFASLVSPAMLALSPYLTRTELKKT